VDEGETGDSLAKNEVDNRKLPFAISSGFMVCRIPKFTTILSVLTTKTSIFYHLVLHYKLQ
jgi:hypothetical protein